jgi:O-antigen/teichoic acid export membrane protein
LYFNFKILERAWKFYILGIVGTSYIYLAQIFEKEFGSFEQLATLSISLLILSGLNLFGTVLVKYILPKAHKFWLSRDMKSLSKLYNNNTFIEILVTLPIYIIILINLEYIAYLLGDGFNNLKVVFYILSFGYMIDLLTGITGTLLRVTENEIYEIWNEIIRFIIGMVLIFILKDYKYGVIVSISISSFIYNFIKFIEVYRVLGLTPLNKSQIKLLVKYFSIYVVFLFLIIFSIDTILVTFVLELTTVLIFFYYVFKILIKDKTILGVYS